MIKKQLIYTLHVIFKDRDIRIICKTKPTKEFIILVLEQMFSDEHQVELLQKAIDVVIDSGIPKYGTFLPGGIATGCKEGGLLLNAEYLYENNI